MPATGSTQGRAPMGRLRKKRPYRPKPGYGRGYFETGPARRGRRSTLGDVPEEFRLTPAEVHAEVEQWAGLITKLAAYYKDRAGGRVTLDDARHTAILGFLDAGRRFDRRKQAPDGRPIRFVTYAVCWARKWLREMVFQARGERKPSRGTWSGVVVLSLDAPARFPRPGSRCLADQVPDRPPPPPAPEFPADFWPRIRRVLDPRSYEVLAVRYGAGATLDRVGEVMGLTRERVRQIEQKALDKIANLVEFGDYLGDP